VAARERRERGSHHMNPDHQKESVTGDEFEFGSLPVRGAEEGEALTLQKAITAHTGKARMINLTSFSHRP
jgi:hypothetical protein